MYVPVDYYQQHTRRENCCMRITCWQGAWASPRGQREGLDVVWNKLYKGARKKQARRGPSGESPFDFNLRFSPSISRGAPFSLRFSPQSHPTIRGKLTRRGMVEWWASPLWAHLQLSAARKAIGPGPRSDVFVHSTGVRFSRAGLWLASEALRGRVPGMPGTNGRDPMKRFCFTGPSLCILEMDGSGWTLGRQLWLCFPCTGTSGMSGLDGGTVNFQSTVLIQR